MVGTEIRKDFLQELAAIKRYSRLTVEAYANDLEGFELFVKTGYEADYNSCTRDMVRDWVVSMAAEGMKPATIARKLSAVKSLYKYGLRVGLLSENPAVMVKPPKKDKPLPQFISAEKMEQLLEDLMQDDGSFTAIRDKYIIEMLFGTGMRRAELVGLKCKDVDAGRGLVKVLGKRNKERLIPMHNSLLELHKQYLVRRRDYLLQSGKDAGDWLLPDEQGNALTAIKIYNTVTRLLRMVSTQAKVSPHVLRHSYATALLNRGADLNAIKELLGHASLAATQVYTHTDIDKLKAIMEKAHPRG